jgi:hypothetical protein
MRVLLDECVPRRLGLHLPDHEWSTVPKEGLAGLKNGELLTAIQGKWDVLLTTDKNIPWQQVVKRYSIAVVIIRARSNDIEDLLQWVPEGCGQSPM